jgi:hypothetical protein
MYPWLHVGPFALSTYSLLFLCAFIVGGILQPRMVLLFITATLMVYMVVGFGFVWV